MRGRTVSANRRQRRQAGNSLLEFALASGLLFLLTFGVADFGRIFHLADVASSAAAAATQYGALSPAHYGDFDGMRAAALTDAQHVPGMTVEASNFCACSIGGTRLPCPATCSGPSQTYIQANVTIPFSTLSNFPGLPQTTPIRASSTVRVR